MTIRQAGSLLILAGLVASYSACSANGFQNIAPAISTNTDTTTTPPTAGSNVMAMTVGACGVNGYLNEPCVSVTICTPGTNNCQVIPNILLDTGSYGLRIFDSVIGVSLSQVDSLYECAQFADGSSDWGPVKYADVGLAGLKASQIPIHVINSKVPTTIPTGCPNPDDSPADAGFNGILGVGLFDVDCLASGCPANVGLYFTCSSTSCSSQPAVPAAKQVVNPVAMLPTDNNGVILQLPSVVASGSGSVSGSVILGIGTRTNNTLSPSSVTYFPADQNGNFITTFNSQTLSSSFIDSGSNGLFFPQPSGLTACDSKSSAYGFYCPTSLTSYSAVQKGATGANSKTIPFSIANATTLVNSGNTVSSTLGGTFSGVFDWGLPFFLGRSVVVGIDGRTSNLGTGPYWAY
jgi:hypothetical protein